VLTFCRQGLGVTWSIFAPEGKQDLHAYGLPAVGIYGGMEGGLQITALAGFAELRTNA
jgi:hypothetical protein